MKRYRSIQQAAEELHELLQSVKAMGWTVDLHQEGHEGWIVIDGAWMVCWDHESGQWLRRFPRDAK